MAGHNKWSKVKHIKGVVDAKRSRLFSKLAKEISIAARDGGDPDLNPRLRNAIATARKLSMPGDNIERAVKKGTGELGGDAIEEIVYEGYGPGGVAFLIEVATDNKNRSAADMRTLFNKNDGSFGTAGSVAYLFDRIGEIAVESGIGEDALLEAALESGAGDVRFDDPERPLVITRPAELFEVAASLLERGVAIAEQKLSYMPQTTIPVNDSQQAAKVIKLYEALDDYDDTQQVHSNFDIPDAILEQLGS